MAVLSTGPIENNMVFGARLTQSPNTQSLSFIGRGFLIFAAYTMDASSLSVHSVHHLYTQIPA